VTTFYAALRAELERVDASSWRAQLDALHDQHGSWKATAAAMGVTPRTVERWRNGYISRGRRIQARPESVMPRIREAIKGDRKAQAGAVDWSRLRIKGTIELDHNPRYRRKENMHVGKYLTAGAIGGLVAAYVARSAERVQRAIDNAMSEDYVANGDTRLLSVDELDFGR
jgi:hypothetical protein